MPVGNGDLKKVLEDMIEDANREGERFCMLEYAQACALT